MFKGCGVAGEAVYTCIPASPGSGVVAREVSEYGRLLALAEDGLFIGLLRLRLGLVAHVPGGDSSDEAGKGSHGGGGEWINRKGNGKEKRQRARDGCNQKRENEVKERPKR